MYNEDERKCRGKSSGNLLGRRRSRPGTHQESFHRSPMAKTNYRSVAPEKQQAKMGRVGSLATVRKSSAVSFYGHESRTVTAGDWRRTMKGAQSRTGVSFF